MKFSENGQEILKKMEGFLSQPENDAAGYPTIGYGHKIKSGERFAFLTETTASEVLLKDVPAIEGLLNNYIKTKLNQNQFDALVIFIYNIGITAFLNSSVFTDIQKGNFEEATIPWAKWINITVRQTDETTGEVIKKLIPIKGLENRRAQEINLFNT
jgi:lysozyme